MGTKRAKEPTLVERLWACHVCEHIGTETEAQAHHIVRGHEIEELDEATTRGIFAEWKRLGDPRAA